MIPQLFNLPSLLSFQGLKTPSPFTFHFPPHTDTMIWKYLKYHHENPAVCPPSLSVFLWVCAVSWWGSENAAKVKWAKRASFKLKQVPPIQLTTDAPTTKAVNSRRRGRIIFFSLIQQLKLIQTPRSASLWAWGAETIKLIQQKHKWIRLTIPYHEQHPCRNGGEGRREEGQSQKTEGLCTAVAWTQLLTEPQGAGTTYKHLKHSWHFLIICSRSHNGQQNQERRVPTPAPSASLCYSPTRIRWPQKKTELCAGWRRTQTVCCLCCWSITPAPAPATNCEAQMINLGNIQPILPAVEPVLLALGWAAGKRKRLCWFLSLTSLLLPSLTSALSTNLLRSSCSSQTR